MTEHNQKDLEIKHQIKFLQCFFRQQLDVLLLVIYLLEIEFGVAVLAGFWGFLFLTSTRTSVSSSFPSHQAKFVTLLHEHTLSMY